MATAAMLLFSGASTLLGVVSAINQGEAQAKAAEENAKAAEGYAKLTREQTAEQVRRKQFENKLALGSIRAAYGASGITMEGSATDVMQQAEKIAKSNELELHYQGVLKAAAYQREANNYRNQAGNDRSAGLIKGVAVGLSGAADAFKTLYPARASTTSTGDV